MKSFKFVNLLLFPRSSVIIINYKNICGSVCNFNLQSDKKITVLENVREDLSDVTPYFPNSYNLAAYVNSSEVLKNLVHLKVNLSKIEKKPHIVERILKLDWNQNIKEHIMFMKDYIDSEEIGNYITKNPMILCESLENLDVRVNYLKSKNFSKIQIQRIISKNSFWLMFSTIRIDRRLGYLQKHFSLSGEELRFLAAKQPNIVTYNLHDIKTKTFVIKEEMGFNDSELKQLIISKPKLWMLNQRALLERFNYIHNVIGIPHVTLLRYPEVLLSRNFKVKQRHLFLLKLGRAQYNPTKENYVPIKALVENTDVEFCQKYAKSNVDDFNIFLKTM